MCVKKKLGLIKKVQCRVAGREQLLLNHPPVDPNLTKRLWSVYIVQLCTTKSGECVEIKTTMQVEQMASIKLMFFSHKSTLVSVHCTIVHKLSK